MKIVRYSPDQASRWDEFVEASANGTFLHLRSYMDYHSDRFADCSLMVYSDSGRLTALLPANIKDTTLYSHGGLTYGGWIVARRHCLDSVLLEAMDAAREWMADNGINELIYKPVPHIYHQTPCEADIYYLWLNGASMKSCLLSSAIDLRSPRCQSESSRQASRHATEQKISLCMGPEAYVHLADFYTLLCRVLAERHDTRPVHSLDEIKLLMSRFPNNIKLAVAHSANGELLAGTLVYITATVAHTQYIAVSPLGRKTGVFAAIIDYVADALPRGCRYLDFGNSNEDNGFILNTTLNQQKYQLGGRPTVYTEWILSTTKTYEKK